jgi:hypothetical protein
LSVCCTCIVSIEGSVRKKLKLVKNSANHGVLALDQYSTVSLHLVFAIFRFAVSTAQLIGWAKRGDLLVPFYLFDLFSFDSLKFSLCARRVCRASPISAESNMELIALGPRLIWRQYYRDTVAFALIC